VVSNLYVRQANLKVILELTGSQCSSESRAVAGCCERLGKTTRATEVCHCNFLMLVEPWIREFACIVIRVWIREAATVLISHVACECLLDVAKCLNMKV